MPRAPLATPRRWQATLILTAFCLAVAAAAVTGWWYARESTPHQGPIVLLSINGLRPAALRAYGGPGDRYPAIDTLSADAVVFERAYTHSPLTLPAHASILAGQLPFEHGVRDEAGFALKDDARPIAELLRSRGFETGAAVSSFVLRPKSGVAQGFSFFDAELPAAPVEGGPAVERDGRLTADVAGKWLSGRRGHRFFLFVQVDERAADDVVASLVSQLKSQGLYDQATIVLTADHAASGAGLSLDDAALRVPLIVKQPGRRGAGRQVATPVQHIDILPTVLDLVRAPIPSGLRGRSLRRVLDGDADGITAPFIYADSLAASSRFGGAGKFSLATPTHRYVRGSREELIDLQDGAAISPARDLPEAAELRDQLDRLIEGHEPTPPEDVDAADEGRFAMLGYLGGGRLVGTNPEPLDPDQEAWVMDTHRAAAVLTGQKRYNAAVSLLRSITRAHPGMAVVHYQAGTLLGQAGRREEAMRAFQAAARVEPDNPYIAIAMARLVLRDGRPEEAREHAALAIALAEHRTGSARATAEEVAARVALTLEDFDSAEAHAEAAGLDEGPGPVGQFVRGRIFFSEGRYEDARAAFDAAAAGAGRDRQALEDLHLSLGETLARLERFPEAEEHFREELRAFPRSIGAYASLAMLYHASDRRAAVEEVLEALVDATRTSEGYDTAARLWTMFGEPVRAAAVRADARAWFRAQPSPASLAQGARR